MPLRTRSKISLDTLDYISIETGSQSKCSQERFLLLCAHAGGTLLWKRMKMLRAAVIKIFQARDKLNGNGKHKCRELRCDRFNIDPVNHRYDPKAAAMTEYGAQRAIYREQHTTMLIPMRKTGSGYQEIKEGWNGDRQNNDASKSQYHRQDSEEDIVIVSW